MTSLSIKDFDAAMNLDATNNGAVSKLVKAWEAKNGERAKRVAGLGLMAVSLAACGGEDDTPYSQADMDALESAVATAVAAKNAADAARVAAEAAEEAAESALAAANETLLDSQSDAAAAETARQIAVAAAEQAAALAEDALADAAVAAAALETATEALAASEAAEAAAVASLNAANAQLVVSQNATAAAQTAAQLAAQAQAAAVAAQATLQATLTDMQADIAAAGFDSLDALIAAYQALANPINYVLTTTAELIAGNANNNFIFGSVDSDTAANDTLNAGDVLDGGAGTDTLVLTFATAGATAMPSATITNIENFSIQNVSGQALSINFAGIDGEANVASNMSTSAFTVSNLAAGTSFDVVGNGAVANSTSDIGYVATAGAGDLDIMNGVTGGAITITGTGLLSQSITSTGAANTVGAITLAATTVTLTIDATTNLTTGAITDTGGADAMTTIVITGAGAVDIDAADLEAEVTTVNASGATGALSVAIGDVADAGVVNGVDLVDATITGGAGNDSINVDALVAGKEVNVNAGAGNDTVTIGEVVTTSGAATVGDVLNGGEGTDTLAMTTAIATAQTAATTVSNFEAITVSNAITGGTLDVTNFQATGITTVNLAAGAGVAGTGVVTFAAGANTLNIAAANAGALTVNDTGTATNDSLTINNTATTQTDVYADRALAINGFETVNISTTSGTGTAEAQNFAAITLTVDTGGTGTVNFSGANVANINGIVTAHALSFAGMTAQATGTATADMTGTSFEYAGATGSGTITGSAGDDVLVGDIGESTNIDGGAGNDNITGGSAAETLSGGEGNDTIAGGGGADTLNGGAGNDTITLGGATASAAGGDGDDTVVADIHLTFGTTVVGGAGTDAISITAAVLAANGSVVSGFETLVLGGNINQDLDNFGSNTFSTVSLENDIYTVTSVRSQVIQLTAALGGASTITLEDATGTTDSVTVQMSSAAALDATNLVTIAGVETINLVMVDSNTAAHVNTIDLVANSATRLVVSGNAGLNFATDAAEDIADVVTMDASGVVLGAVTATGVTYTATYNLVGGSTTITGSNGVDSLTGGSATNDTIVGGSGVDTIVYTGGSDTVTGGAGNDVFDINADGTLAAHVFIADLTVGDTIDLVGVTDGDAGISDGALGAAISLGGAATLANYLDNAASDTTDVGGGGGRIDVSLAKWFQFDGDTYIVVDNSIQGTYQSGTDTLVQIDGLIDLSTSTFAAEVLTVVAV